MRALVVASCLFCAISARGIDYFVNNRIGDDALDGKAKTVTKGVGPFQTIAKAVDAVKPGDTIHLAPTGKVYRESIILLNRSGEPGKPITIEGHGAWLTGSEHCTADGWQPYPEGEDGTLVRSDLAGKGPWFSLCIDGEMTWGVRSMDVLHPGEFCFDKKDKNNTVYFHPPKGLELEADTVQAILGDGTTVSLDPAKWHASHSRSRAVRRNRSLPEPPTRLLFRGQPIKSTQARRRLKPGQWARAGQDVYFRPPAGKVIADVKMLTVPRSSTVALQGNCAHIVIKNLNAVYTANDGYNIHGAAKDTHFLNCNAFYCFDEGFSSHDTCETELDGGIYIHCDNGIANVNRCISVTRNVICDSARSVGLLLPTRASPRHQTVENIILIDSPSQCSATKTDLDNMLIVRGGQAMSFGAKVSVKRTTVVGTGGLLRLDKASSAQLADCLFATATGKVHVRAEDPLAPLSMGRVVLGAGAIMEWGIKYPWKTQPMTEWLAQAGDAATDCRVTELTFQEELLAGRAPSSDATPTGCTPELYARYIRYLAERESLLETARRMAWGE